jgi:hypothetical protein
MGLRGGKDLNYGTTCTFWKVQRVADNGKTCDVQISVSKKNKQTDQYETDFSGFVKFCGENMVKLAQSLQEKDKIDIDSFELTNKYDKEKKVTYYNVSVFAAKKHEWDDNGGSKKVTGNEDFMKVEDNLDDESLPFN